MIARIPLVTALVLVLSGSAVRHTPAVDPPISLHEFGRLMTELSEPEGYFDTDNLISNEAAYLRVLPPLRRRSVTGGAYIGVGPDQNYSYIAELRPGIAVIVDIRRQNALLHLYYKALFQLSPDRASFLERIFGRRLGPGRGAADGGTITALLDRIAQAPQSEAFEKTALDAALAAVRAWKLPLLDSDYRAIDYVARSFFRGGPDVKFTTYNREPRREHPSYRELLEERDSVGLQTNYLAADARFARVKALHRDNRIVPVVGDFSGAHAFRSIGAELRRRGLLTRCFYASNVEFYLYRGQRWDLYVRNLRSLPLAADAYVIRTYANMWQSHPAQVPGYYMTTVLQPLAGFLEAEATGTAGSYLDLVTRDCILK
jgi:hypothetical protein